MDIDKIVKEEILNAFSDHTKSEMALAIALNKDVLNELVESAKDTQCMPFMDDEKFVRSLVYCSMKLCQYDFQVTITKV